MSGHTMSMAPAVESTDTNMFHQSHSSPDLLTLGSLPNSAHCLNKSDKQPSTHSTHIFDNIRHTAGSQGSHSLSPLPSPSLTSLPSTFPSSLSSPSAPKQPSSSTTKTAAFGAAGPATIVSASSTPDLANISPPSPSFNTSSASSPSLSSLSKDLPSLPAFDVPSFDFDGDLDCELEFSVLRKRKQQKPVDPPNDTPRRVWEEFIKKDDFGTLNKENTASPYTSDFGAELEARFGPPASASDNSDVNPLSDFASENNSSSVTTESCMLQRPSTAVAPSTKQQALDKEKELAGPEKLTRRRTIVERPLSWIPSSRSAPDFHDLLVKEREKDSRKGRHAVTGPSTRTSRASSLFQRTPKDEKIANSAGSASATLSEASLLQVDSDRMGERQKTVSASFVDFAKRSWISRSPSPSPSSSPSRRSLSKRERDEEKKKDKERAKEREKEEKKERERGREDSSRPGGRLSRKRTVSTIFGGTSSSAASNDDETSIPSAAAPVEIDQPFTGASQPVGSLDADVSTTTANGDGGPVPFGHLANAQSANANGATTAEPISIVVVPPASTSRTFGRASEYLSRMKQRPQSMFVKAVANSTSTKLTGSSEDLSDDLKPFDDESNGRTSTSSSLSLSLELLSNKSLKPSRSAGRKLGENSGSNSSANSDDGSSDGSANGSALLPASEAESLTTADTSNNSPMAHPNSRDPHWVAFKDLETNFFKFLSKTTTAQRMIIVRATLAPFLRRYANDASGKNNSPLSPEDIERRASILNRWWTGLLEMLDAPSQYQGNNGVTQTGGLFGSGTFFGTSTTVNGTFTPVSGIDRPVVLESVSMIMSRPEWRLLTSIFRPINSRPTDENDRTGANAPGVSPVDESSIFVEESAEHNVRTMFVNNLLAQLILVVDKMSMRQAPLSIVNFSGKACAYAFFFVPGVADILVRLWGLEKNIELIRRTADAFGLPRRSRTRSASDELAANFPPCIGPLGWSSVISTQANLRKPPKMSQLPPAYVSACSRVTWFAPCWLSRWRGSDTDLLFIFAKYYHILASDFMPSSLKLSLTEKARAPGFVLLHSQLLLIFDNTIHRQAAVEAAMLMAGAPVGDGTPSLWTQQQMQKRQPYMMTTPNDTPGASMAIQPSYNLFRDMDENRIIALLRDFLESGEPVADARDTFAETSMVLLKAATFRTSQYDHNACYILCDFLQEILLTFDSYYGYRDAKEATDDNTGVTSQLIDHIDWTFWLDICKMMLNSNNTMSEIRVLSFIFATWDIVTADPQRKEELCVRWLLSEEVFDKFFNNWCPMVRAYYMRLLCWRVCRDSGSPNEFDARIFLLVSQRLKNVWSHYLWLKQNSDKAGILQPSTAPSLPQPGKRFMIVRTEVNSGSQLGLLASTNNGGSGDFNSPNPNSRTATTFDALASTVGGISSINDTMSSSGSDTSSINSVSSIGDDKKDSGTKKKWSLFGKVLSLANKPPSDEEFEQMRRNTAMARAASGKAGASMPPLKPMRLGSPSSDSGSSTGSAPVFDASQFVFKFMLHNIPWQGAGGQGDIVLPPAYRERVLTRPRLPAPAQSCVSARLSAADKRTESPPPAAGMPPVTRRVSGLTAGGLINEARNANPSEFTPYDDASSSASRSNSVSSSRPSLGYQRGSSPFGNSGEWERSREPSPLPRNSLAIDDFNLERERERVVVQPIEPQDGDAKLRAKYAGRALAEWSLVVNECNSFVDRRRDEGVYGLRDVEVPTLGVEGMRRLG
ncbi:gpi inositol-deacylase [Ophiostoma piceae UAMH 11346]|uniref:Gpi inositol-deacylase n=1 Tax=Ophiostoma piceae (strain UAMH 11346) TaxID=1262450 RepID=S3D671_OPHP1|nr:gpi inositol-deacylase [Ophiostoma piceae UAMH 11346]